MKASIIGAIVMVALLGVLYALTGGSGSKSEEPAAAPAEQAAPAAESNSAFKL